MDEELHKNLEISDFQLASFLIYRDTDNEKTQALIEKFSNLSAEVEPLAFSSAQKRLKQLLYLSLDK